MKVVINKCFGGFGLSPLGKKRLAELQGRKCFFYKHNYKNDSYYLISDEEAENEKASMSLYAFDTDDKSLNKNDLWDGGHFIAEPDERTDPNLIQVVEELGEKANGWAAKLQIVDIPDGISWHMEDYDGIETIHEDHASW